MYRGKFCIKILFVELFKAYMGFKVITVGQETNRNMNGNTEMSPTEER